MGSSQLKRIVLSKGLIGIPTACTGAQVPKTSWESGGSDLVHSNAKKHPLKISKYATENILNRSTKKKTEDGILTSIVRP